MKEVTRGFLGTSTKVLEDTRKDALSKDFNFDLITLRDKIKAILKDEGVYVYREDIKSNLIAVYLDAQDTTPAGIFLTDLGQGKSRIEVSSPSKYGKEFIAGVVFDSLEGKPRPKVKKGIFNAKI